MLGERKNISAPIAQGWNRKREHVQAEVQIFPKTACFDSRRKVHIRQGHDTRFDAQRFRAAQAFERLGGTETLRIEARVMALTNVDLPAAVKAGSFREDLYFRLNVLTLTVPPLRDRRADILPLAEHLLGALRAAHGRPHAQLGESARRMLAAYAWPGNVRELRNALERAVVFSS